MAQPWVPLAAAAFEHWFTFISSPPELASMHSLRYQHQAAASHIQVWVSALGDPNTNLQSPISLTLFHFLCSRVTVTSWSSYLCITSLIPYKSLLKWTMQRTEEHNRMGKSRDLFKKFWVTKGTFNAKMDTIKDRKCVDLTEEEYIKR